VFDPGLGLLRAGFFFSRYGFDLCAILGAIPKNPRKNKRREEFPRRVRGLIAGTPSKSRKTGLKTGQTWRIWP
jgi:hypothetical protein